MRLLLLLIACAGLLVCADAEANTTLAAPYIAACPSPVPPAWPTSACKYQFIPVSMTAPQAVASVSKTAPVYAHTYSGYVGGKFTGVLVACPVNATLSTDATQCLDSTGKDASGLVTLAQLPTFKIAASTPLPPPPPVDDYSTIVSYVIEQSYDGGTTWDSISTTVTYPTQTVAHCFRITAKRKDGDGPGVLACPKPK